MPEISASKKIKGLLCLTYLGGAFAIASMGMEDTEEVVKKAEKIKVGSTKIVMIDPADPEFFGIGDYKIGGVAEPNSKLSVFLDKQPPIEVTADKTGEYIAELKIKEVGKHVIAVKLKEKGGKEQTFKYEFKNAKFNNGSKDADVSEAIKKPAEKQGAEDAPSNLLPNSDDSDVKYAGDSGASEAKANKPVAKPKPTPKPTAKPAIKGVPFVISSHSNFNTVKPGIINVGGKGNTGDKIMLLVDGKPSMKGTIKPNGRWTFPVKVNSAGKRVFTAQNLKTKKIAKVILFIK